MLRMAGSMALALLLTVTAGCGPAGDQAPAQLPATRAPVAQTPSPPSLAESILAEINAARRRAGLEPLSVHPALSEIAVDQAHAVAATGGTTSSSGYITDTTDRLHRAGYAVHRWTEGSLIAASGADVAGQWRRARPDWWREAEAGDFEDVGIGVASYQGRPVVTLILALKTRTWEWRQAAPLADLETVRQQALAEVNRLRRDHGREPLASEPHLDEAAQRHAEDMLRRAYYDHKSPEGDGVGDRVRAAGYGRYRTVAENIAKGLFTPDEVVRRWANSSGHRRNLLHRRVTETGLGVAYGETGDEFEVVWVQVFARR